MRAWIKTLPLLAALAAAPAFAAGTDEHAGHHPPGAAAPAAPVEKPKADAQAPAQCAMMKEHMAGGQMMGGQAKPQADAKPGQPMAGMGSGGMMKDMHCMAPAKAQAQPPADPAHSHDHSGK